MIVRWLIVAGVGGVLFVCGGSTAAFGNEAGSANRGATSALLEVSAPIIDEILFVGLRHLSQDAVRAQISSRAGAKLDLKRIELDVRALGRLGWFGEIEVEMQQENVSSPTGSDTAQRVRLVFHLEELPYLAKVEYAGSRLLSTSQIEKILGDKQLIPRLGEPTDPAKLWRISNTIQTALAELGHPQPLVQIRREVFSNGIVRVRFEIEDGPHIPVGRIDFDGYPSAAPKLLRREMRRTAPGALFASWRGKDAYTREGFEEDRARILIYYQDHGFPEARIGEVRTSVYEKTAGRWTRWPFRSTGKRLAVTVPIEAGPAYRVESVDISPDLLAASGKHGRKLLAYSKTEAGSAYSAKTLEDLRHAWVAGIQLKREREKATAERSVETSRTL